MTPRGRLRWGAPLASLACAVLLAGCSTTRAPLAPSPPLAAVPIPAPTAAPISPPTPAPLAPPTSSPRPGAAAPAQAVHAAGPAAPERSAGAKESPPPCLPAPAKVHHKKRRHNGVEEPQGPELPSPAPAPNAAVNAQVGEIGTSLASILGKDVTGPRGEKLGRVVDVLADAQGRVRAAIIDFGGFLGVGTRRIAVDWPLLHFEPSSKDRSVTLSVTREKLQSAPEYKDSNNPRVLMPPAPPDAAESGQTTR